MRGLTSPITMFPSAGILLLFLLTGCVSHTEIISSESEKSNVDAVRIAQKQIASSELKGCKTIAISGGPSVAVGIVIGEACVDCKPLQQSQHRQVYVVNVLMNCPGTSSETSN